MARKAAAGVLALAVLSGCGSGGEPTKAVNPSSAPTAPPGAGAGRERPAQRLEPSHCPPGLRACRSAAGPIVYVERVDPDGDGDAHFVIVDPQGISLPGITAIDVRRGLRPQPLPGIGERISAAGPVQTGSYGQSQIHALEVHVAGGD